MKIITGIQFWGVLPRTRLLCWDVLHVAVVAQDVEEGRLTGIIETKENNLSGLVIETWE